jgi:hypothetical protein
VPSLKLADPDFRQQEAEKILQEIIDYLKDAEPRGDY